MIDHSGLAACAGEVLRREFAAANESDAVAGARALLREPDARRGTS